MWEEREWLGKAHTHQLRLYFSPVFWGSQHLLSQGTSAHLHLICSPRDWLSLPKDPSKTPFLQFLISRLTPGPGGPWAASVRAVDGLHGFGDPDLLTETVTLPLLAYHVFSSADFFQWYQPLEASRVGQVVCSEKQQLTRTSTNQSKHSV